MIHPLLSLVLIALLLAKAPQDPAQDAARERIAAAVAATGLAHEKSPSGSSFVLDYEHDGNRHQRVFVSIGPSLAGSRQMHTVYTTVWNGKEPPADELMRKVFSRSKKFGTFYLFVDQQGTWAIRFSGQFDSTAMPARPARDDPGVVALRALIEFVNQVGEETDRELNGDRDLR